MVVISWMKYHDTLLVMSTKNVNNWYFVNSHMKFINYVFLTFKEP